MVTVGSIQINVSILNFSSLSIIAEIKLILSKGFLYMQLHLKVFSSILTSCSKYVLKNLLISLGVLVIKLIITEYCIV
jgi:hypothetical protein